MTVSILVNKLDNCFVEHLLEPAMKRCFTGGLCRFKSKTTIPTIKYLRRFNKTHSLDMEYLYKKFRNKVVTEIRKSKMINMLITPLNRKPT